MSCHDGSCEVQSAVRRVANGISDVQRAEALAFCYFCRDLNLKAGDEAGARRWQVEINRIEKGGSDNSVQH